MKCKDVEQFGVLLSADVFCSESEASATGVQTTKPVVQYMI
ncbi:hypothetical protein [Lysinibacillus sp. NPDC056232]